MTELVSEVLVWLGETESLFSVDSEVRSVDIVSLHDHIKDFRLVNGSFLHEVDDLILDSDGVVHIVVKLDLELVFELTVLFEEIFIIDGVCEVLVILSQKMHLAVVGPRVESITHGVLCPYTSVFTASKEQQSVDFLVERLPVQDVGHPCDRVCQVKERKGDLPRPEEWVDEEHVPGEWHQAIIHAVGVLEVDGGVLNVVARVQKQFTLSVELDGLGRLIDTVGSLEVLLSTLGKLSLRSVDDLVQVVDLTEVALGSFGQHTCTLGGSEQVLGSKRAVESCRHRLLQHFVFYFIKLLDLINFCY